MLKHKKKQKNEKKKEKRKKADNRKIRFMITSKFAARMIQMIMLLWN